MLEDRTGSQKINLELDSVWRAKCKEFQRKTEDFEAHSCWRPSTMGMFPMSLLDDCHCTVTLAVKPTAESHGWMIAIAPSPSLSNRLQKGTERAGGGGGGGGGTGCIQNENPHIGEWWEK